MAGVVCIKKEEKVFGVEWFVTPEILE